MGGGAIRLQVTVYSAVLLSTELGWGGGGGGNPFTGVRLQRYAAFNRVGVGWGVGEFVYR